MLGPVVWVMYRMWVIKSVRHCRGEGGRVAGGDILSPK